jgi:hypothetical protein
MIGKTIGPPKEQHLGPPRVWFYEGKKKKTEKN